MSSKNIRKFLCHIMVLALVCTMTSGMPVSSAAKKASIAKKNMVLKKGTSKKIIIKNKNKNARYTFKASNKKIKASKKGKIKAIKVGKAKVTVKEIFKGRTKKVGTVKVTIVKNSNTASLPSPASSVIADNTTVNTQAPSPDQTSPSAATAEPVPTEDTATQEPVVSSEPVPSPTPVTIPEPVPSPDATPTQKPDDEVIYSNYFEDGDTNGFTGRGTASVEISNSENHTDGGMNSMFVTGRAATWHGVQLSLSKLTSTGSNYQFSSWVKQTSGATENIAMKIQYTDSDGTDHYVSPVSGGDNGISCASGEWVELSGEYVIPENNGSIYLYFEVPSSETASFLIDDVVIIGTPVVSSSFTASDEQYNKMISDSLYSTGNNARIKKVIEKARAGEDVSLAYIGGSVTEGALASPNSKCYAEASAAAFAGKYGTNGGSNVHFINAGMSGTSSDIGVVRYKRDVISRLPAGSTHPDILFIEFAVNDWGCDTAGGAYEGLIREALSSGSAVVLIFAVFQPKNVVCETDYRRYGAHYDIPMVSMGNAINSVYTLDGFDEWYFGDSLHPNNTGYKLMADCIMNLMDTIDKENAEQDNITDINNIKPLKTDSYQGIKMIDAKETADGSSIISINAGGFSQKDSATGSFQYEYNGKKGAAWFPDNWMHSPNSGSDSFKVSLNCKTLMFIYKLSNSSTYGSADLYIDGVKKATLSCYDTSGWNNGKVYLALTESETAKHDIELKMASGSENKNFTLLAIGYK